MFRVSLPRSTPSAQGASSGGIAAFIDAMATAGLELHSLMLVRHGHVIAEAWWQPYTAGLPHMLFSLSKSFTATAVGLAIGQGHLSLDDLVASFFPEISGIGPHMASMRIRHLLTMATGQDPSPSLPDRDDGSWTAAFLHSEPEQAPGSRFLYNNGASYMLSAIVQRCTGQDLLGYLTPNLFNPLGIQDPTWDKSPEGVCTGGWGLSLRTEDVARFGQLYLQGGAWAGQQRLLPHWVTEATRAQIVTGTRQDSDWAQGYGYHFWRCQPEGCYRGDGMYGQFCVVLPPLDAVLSITAAVDDMQALLHGVWTHILPALQHTGTAADDAALALRLHGLSVVSKTGGAPGSVSDRIVGRRFCLAPNPAEIASITLEVECDRIVLTLEQQQRVRRIVCGVNHWETTMVPGVYGEGLTDCAGYATVTAPECWSLHWYFPRTPAGRALHIHPGPGGLALRYCTNVGEHARGLTLALEP